MPSPKRFPPTALALMVHAFGATRVKTPEATAACNERVARARDFLVHSQAVNIAAPHVAIREDEFDALRRDALKTLRAHCSACGLCAHFGLQPP